MLSTSGKLENFNLSPDQLPLLLFVQKFGSLHVSVAA